MGTAYRFNPDWARLEAGLRAAEAAMKTAQAALRLANLDLEFTKVRAPCDGRVHKVFCREGGQVSGGQDLLVIVGE